MLWMLTALQAHGFCGAYVGPVGAELTNESSRVVIADNPHGMALTVVNDFHGDVEDFALVMPIPPGLTEADVVTIDEDIIDDLAEWSAPRSATYTCSQVYGSELQTDSKPLGCGVYEESSGDTADTAGDDDDDDTSGDDDYGVKIEAEFQVSEYDIVVLSAEGGDGLNAWLNDNGYAMPKGTDDVLQSYIETGTQFVAAKVHLDNGQRWLSPLQFRIQGVRPYSVGLPIRLGTVASRGLQEVEIFFLSNERHNVRIANYPQLEVRTECMWPKGEFDSLDAFYEHQLENALAEAGGAGWIEEYSWRLATTRTGYHCDPCTTVSAIPEEDILSLGMRKPTLRFVHATRIKLLYSPEHVEEAGDVVFDLYGDSAKSRQLRYIEYDKRLESAFPVCGKGFVEDPGQCAPDSSGWDGFGCSVASPATPLGVLAVSLFLVIRRRRAAIAVVALGLLLTDSAAAADIDVVLEVPMRRAYFEMDEGRLRRGDLSVGLGAAVVPLSAGPVGWVVAANGRLYGGARWSHPTHPHTPVLTTTTLETGARFVDLVTIAVGAQWQFFRPDHWPKTFRTAAPLTSLSVGHAFLKGPIRPFLQLRGDYAFHQQVLATTMQLTPPSETQTWRYRPGSWSLAAQVGVAFR